MNQLENLEERHEEVLRGIIEEYVRLASPVSSSHLASRLPVSVSSATVRNIMHDLEVERFIHQPHTSAGRVPTDKGYRYYVDRLVKRTPQPSQLQQIEKRYQQLSQEYNQLHRARAKLVSHLSRSVAVSYSLPDKDFYEAGLHQLLAEPEAQEQGAMREVSDFLENVDDYVEQLAPTQRDSSLVLIGQENPAYEGEHTSLILRNISLGNGQHMILAIIGPKRMPYRQHVNLLEGIARFVEQENNI